MNKLAATVCKPTLAARGRRRQMLALSVAFFLGACGSGGGGSGGGGMGAVTLSGVASSGLLTGAQVSVYCGAVAAANLIGQATTGANGAFSVTLTGTCTGPVVTQVSTVAGTTMANKLTGGTTTLSTGLTLTRYDVTLPASGSTALFVTPVSTLVASTVSSIAGAAVVTPAMVQQAISATTTALGVSPAILSTAPLSAAAVATSTSVAAQQLYLLGAAVEQLAATAAGNSAPTAAQLQTALGSVATALSGALTVTPGVGSAPPTVSVAANNGAAATINTAITNLQGNTTLSAAVTPTPLIAPTTTVAVGQVSTAAATGIAAATSNIEAVRSDALAMWTAPSAGYFNTKESGIRTDFKNAAIPLRVVSHGVKAIAEAIVLFDSVNQVTIPPTANAVGPLTDSAGNTYYRTPGFDCRIYAIGSSLAGAGVSSPVAGLIAPATVGGNVPVVCMLHRQDLPQTADASGNPVDYFEILVVTPSGTPGTLATLGPAGSWHSFVAQVTSAAASALVTGVVDPFNAIAFTNQGGVTGSAAATTATLLAAAGGTYATSGATPPPTTGSGSAAVTVSFTGGYEVYDKLAFGATTAPVPDLASMSGALTINLTGTVNATTGKFVVASGGISNIAASVQTAKLSAQCTGTGARCGLFISAGSFSGVTATAGAPASASGTVTATITMPDFEFVGAFNLSATQTLPTATSGKVQTINGGATGNQVFSGKAYASVGGVPASSPWFTGTVALTNWVRAKPVTGGRDVTQGLTVALTGQVVDPAGTYQLNVGDVEATGTTAATNTFTITFVDPAALQVTASIMESKPVTGTRSTTGTISCGDTVVTLTGSRSGTVSSTAAGAQIGTYSNGVVTFTDGTYIVL